jgi:uncharacterized protein with PQ loop repeat
MNQKTVGMIGWIATTTAILTYFSYVDQIRLNLSGHPGSLLIPAFTVLNCCVWLPYAFFLEKKNWPLIISCMVGLSLGLISAITIIHP